jgi:hypothetical protein
VNWAEDKASPFHRLGIFDYGSGFHLIALITREQVPEINPAVLFAFVVLFAIPPVGAFWMMYMSIRHEKNPLALLLLALLPVSLTRGRQSVRQFRPQQHGSSPARTITKIFSILPSTARSPAFTGPAFCALPKIPSCNGGNSRARRRLFEPFHCTAERGLIFDRIELCEPPS